MSHHRAFKSDTKTGEKKAIPHAWKHQFAPYHPRCAISPTVVVFFNTSAIPPLPLDSHL